MKKRPEKEALFQNFCAAAYGTLQSMEMQYGITGILDQFFGEGLDDNDESAKDRVRSSRAWNTLSLLYDYAFTGQTRSGEHESTGSDITIDGSDVLMLANSENYQTSNAWDEIVSMADGRFALDSGDSVDIFKIALLANVDVRTVRNAISAGDLVAQSSQDVENASARRWLHGRKGFVPTITDIAPDRESLASLSSPTEFGSFLAARRKALGTDTPIAPIHPGVGNDALEKLESGLFQLALDTAYPVADFYQVDRRAFLEAVMRIFFPAELDALRNPGIQEAQS